MGDRENWKDETMEVQLRPGHRMVSLLHFLGNVTIFFESGFGTILDGIVSETVWDHKHWNKNNLIRNK